MTTDHSVVVVGCGPVGTAAAIALGQLGVDTLVVDRWPDVYPLPRACHLDDETYRILARLGLGDQVTAITRPAGGLRLLDSDHRVLSEFSRSGVSEITGYPRANMYDQPDLERALRRRLGQLESVTFVGGAEVTALVDRPGGIDVTWRDESGQTSTVTAAYVIGADGANSIVRPFIGARTTDLGFEQRWLVADVETEVDLGQWDGVHQVCSGRRAATYMQIGPTRHRWEFRLRDDEDATTYDDVDALIAMLRPWIGDLPPDAIRPVRVTDYTFRAQVADRWQHGRTFLVGDAAHLTPPFIGQGLCAGLRDAHNVAWKIAGVLQGLLDPSVLDSYEVERRPHAIHMIRMAKAVGRSMTFGGGSGDLLRRAVVPLLPLLPAVRAALLDSSTPPLTPSSLVGTGRLCGAWVPNAALPDGRRLDALIQGRWALISRLPVAPSTHHAVAGRDGVVVEAGGVEQLRTWLTKARVDAVLVRPDGCVTAAGTVSSLCDHLARTARRRPAEVR